MASLDLNAVDEKDLCDEIRRRELLRMAGLCDYCKQPPDSPPCEFPERHQKSERPRAMKGFLRLVQWLQNRPDVLTDLVEALRLPLPKCEGPGTPCGRIALISDRDTPLCPVCLADYDEMVDA